MLVLTKIINKLRLMRKNYDGVWCPHIKHRGFWHEWSREVFKNNDKNNGNKH